MLTTDAETDWQIHRLTMMNGSPRAPAFNYCCRPLARCLSTGCSPPVWQRRHYAEEFIQAVIVIVIVMNIVVITSRLQTLKDCPSWRYVDSRPASASVSTPWLLADSDNGSGLYVCVCVTLVYCDLRSKQIELIFWRDGVKIESVSVTWCC